MAIFLKPNKSFSHVFLHVPKTGGTWVRKQLENLGLIEKIVYAQDFEPRFGSGKTNIHNIPINDKRWDERNSFCFVRNPLTWYKSYYGYRQITPWVPDMLNLDRLCQSETFEGFINKVIKHFPQGYCIMLFNYFTCYNTIILKQEDLRENLIVFLNAYGYKFDESKITHDLINNSDTSKFEYTEEQEKLIRQIERRVFKRFNYE